jgi:hypothetical protein
MYTTHKTKTKTTFIFGKPQLRCLLAFASKDESRSTMLGVVFDPETVEVSATNGHVAVNVGKTWRPTGQGKKRVLVERELLERAHKVATARSKIEVTLTRKSDFEYAVAVQVDGATQESKPDASVYRPKPPPLYQVWPFEPGGHSAHLDASYLAKLPLLAKAAETNAVELHTDGLNATVAAVEGAADQGGVVWSAMLMPLRHHGFVCQPEPKSCKKKSHKKKKAA